MSGEQVMMIWAVAATLIAVLLFLTWLRKNEWERTFSIIEAAEPPKWECERRTMRIIRETKTQDEPKACDLDRAPGTEG